MIRAKSKEIVRFSIVLFILVSLSFLVMMYVAPENSAITLLDLRSNIVLIFVLYSATVFSMSFIRGWIKFK